MGYSHLYYSNSVINPTRTVMFLPNSIRTTAMVHGILVTAHLSVV